MIRRIDRYELLEQVGTGGMAVVYRGRDTSLDREVAVKVLHPHLAERKESRARFSREARAVARLSHPNIVEIFDYAGDAADNGWIVTEFVSGRNLRVFADEVGFGYPEIGVLVGRALADALVHAHSAGVIHRDLKPENVLLAEGAVERAVKLADFGIARILASDDRMTMTGALVGSPNHMAPEIIAGNEADARSDLFSLGTIVYWLITGQLPFAAPNPTATLRRVVEGECADPRSLSPLVSDRLASVVMRVMSSDPAMRHASAAELRDALDGVLLEAGLDDPQAELAAFLGDPVSYKGGFPSRIVGALVRAGEEALTHGATARALGLFNRVLAYEPDSAVVLGHLRRIGRRALVRRGAHAALLLAALLSLGALGWGWLRSRPGLDMPPPRASPSPAGGEGKGEGTSAAHDPRPDPASTERGRARVALSPEGKEGGDDPRSSPTFAERARRIAPGTVALAVHVRPYAQRALLDGLEVARGAQQVTFALTPGRAHVIQIEHACCRPYILRIDAAEAARTPELRVPLVPKPALLRVEGDPTARLYIGERFLGTAGDSQRSPLALDVPAGDSPYEGPVEVRLESEGREPVVVPLRIRAGAELVVASPKKEVEP